MGPLITLRSDGGRKSLGGEGRVAVLRRSRRSCKREGQLEENALCRRRSRGGRGCVEVRR